MRILIIRLSSIGDVILTTPVLKEIKNKYPEAIIDFVVLKKFKDSIEGSKYIDNLILFEKSKHKGIRGILKFVKTIKSNNYDAVFDLHSKMRSLVMCFALGSKTYRYKKRSMWKTILVKLKLTRYSADNTIIKNYFGPFKEFGIEYKGEDLEFVFEEKDLVKVKSYENFIALAPGASKNTKKWTTDGFGKLAALINKKYNKNIMLIGGPGDNEICKEINRVSGDICTDLSGKLSLKESGALLSKADYLVTNDSGPYHVSRGVKTKAFVIFGPTDPKMFEYDEMGTLIFKNEKCSPCSLHGDKKCPKGHFNCMKNLKAEEILEVIEQKMS